MNEETRARIGQALNDAIANGSGPATDYTDSREIDRLVDAVVLAIEPPVRAVACDSKCPHCGAHCSRRESHSGTPLDGMCYCNICCGWWIAGTKTLVYDRSQVQMPGKSVTQILRELIEHAHDIENRYIANHPKADSD